MEKTQATKPTAIKPDWRAKASVDKAVMDKLMQSSADEYRKTVEEDIKADQEDKSTGEKRGFLPDEVRQALRTPPALQRTYMTLSSMQRSVEGQLAAAKADLDSKLARMRRNSLRSTPEWEETIENHKKWRAGALRFKTGVEERMVEISSLVRRADAEFFADRVKEERNEALGRIRYLEDAIAKHRDHTCGKSCSEDFCVADDQLWSMIP